MSAATSSPLLQMDNVSVNAHRSGSLGPAVLDAFSLTIRRGEWVAVVGESGSGKTTAARSVLQLLPPGVRQSGGRIQFEGVDLATVSPARLRAIRGRDIRLVMQEPLTALNPALTIGRQLEEGLRLHTALDRRERRSACLKMLELVRIDDPEGCLAAFPHEFSGGMRQRILLAAAMLTEPKLLIADEPTTALDPLNQREVLEIMAERARSAGTAVMLITHNLALVDRYAERLVVLEQGRIVDAGAVRDVLDGRRHPYTRQLLDSLPSAATRRVRTLSGAERSLLVANDIRVCFSRRGVDRRLPSRAVDGVTLQLAPGEMVALIGGSGSGKTTLGRAVLSLVSRAEGQVKLDGINPRLGREYERAFRQSTQAIFQDPYSSLDPRMKARDIVGEPLRHVRGLSRAACTARVEAMLREVGLEQQGERFPHQLSGGQRQRVAIARALIANPKFVVADEPVSALDMTTQAQILALFQKLQAQYTFACLFITHDLAVVKQLADRVIVMHHGRVVEQGAVETVFERPQAAHTRALLEATIWPRQPAASIEGMPAVSDRSSIPG